MRNRYDVRYFCEMKLSERNKYENPRILTYIVTLLQTRCVIYFVNGKKKKKFTNTLTQKTISGWTRFGFLTHIGGNTNCIIIQYNNNRRVK